MKLLHRFICIYAAFILVGCARNSTQTWEDVKTAGRYMQRGVDVLAGKDYDSRMLTSDEEFTGPNDEFIPLKDTDLKHSFAVTDAALPQPSGIPGKKGLPTLDQFYVPPSSLSTLFQSIHFETDEYVLKDKNEMQAIQQIAAYLKKNPNVYMVISGHCDERASASYNMALGMRRANYVRGLFVKNGVDLNRLYTVSRGKEEPIAAGHNSDDWRINRRAEFKIYEKNN